ncbi:DUF4394 domain-containing protein [Achromobacter sp. GG226]|uniref:DUF4394 domain-containing protein n=1 Tax=Verticiella alkaliphila TaxID=2779529 RepID=UPI001C0DC271|nr:DUF4394 domain-containing protein [Verticiella sp. GG226]MBU4609061.1 DUF4394 domain-containing protein [Verticiella sp. GG226]
MKKTAMLIASAAALVSGISAASAAELWALTADNQLVKFDTDAKKTTGTWKVKGTDTTLRGMDIRPANGQLYALGEDNVLYTIDPATATAKPGAKLSEALPGTGWALASFNPVADRFRLIAADGTNFRVNVESGEVVKDKTLSYAPDSEWKDKTPKVVAGAYTNSYAGTKATQLLNVDANSGALLLQDPPNDGILKTRGKIKDGITSAAFDIWSDGKGGNTAFLLTGGELHTVDLETGKPTSVGKIEGMPSNVIDIAVPRMKAQ